MRTPGDKKATTLRLAPGTKRLLELAARIKRTSESAITDLAIQEWCRTNNIADTSYHLGANDNCFVVIKKEGDVFTVLDQQIRNGKSIEAIRAFYESKYQSPVDLLLEEGSTP